MSSLRTFADADRNTTARVQDEIRADYNKKFARGGTVFFHRLPAFTLCFPSIDAQQYPPEFLEYVSRSLTDKHAKDTLEREFNCLNWQSECTRLIPLYTTGDGNCLLHAASLAMWGIEDKQFILRNALNDSLTTATYDSNTLQDRCRHSVGEVLRGVGVNLSDHDWAGEWQMIVNQATPNTNGYHQSLEESHIFVLANILRRPIIVYGTPKVRSFNTGGTMQNINFHGIYLPLLWGSQLCHKAPLCLAYSTGHFTALVPINVHQNQCTVPIVDNMGRELPIRFLLQAEQQNTSYLLQQYLDVNQQYTAIFRRQVPVAALAIREAGHIPHLVRSYINAAYSEFTRHNQPYYTPGAAPSQGEEIQRRPCVGCDSGLFASAETHFLCSTCYKKQKELSEATSYSGGMRCRTQGCQEQGLTSKDGYCHKCYSRNPPGGNEKFYPNNFDQVGRNNIQNPPPVGGSEQTGERPKCKQCKDFFANEELNGLCSGCFKTLSIKESNEKPPAPQQQYIPPATPIHNVNDIEPVADKCYQCKKFHGDEQWGGLCSMCFKEKSKQEANMKQAPAQMRNDFQQPVPSNQQSWANQQPPPQQPTYGQGRVNPQPHNSQHAANPFGSQCMTRGCARFADDECQGYCTQCFASSVERYQQQQDQQWQNHQQQQYQDDQRRQHEEQERRQLEIEEVHRREQDARKQEEARKLVEIKQQEQWRRQQEQQQKQMHTADLSRTVEYQSQQQYQTQQREHATSYTAPVGTKLCNNEMCSKFADPDCNGFCKECYQKFHPTPAPSNANFTQGEKAPNPSNFIPTQRQKAPHPPSDVNPVIQRPAIKPRSKTALKQKIQEQPAEVSQSNMEAPVAGSSSTPLCFMCAKVKPTTTNFMYSLCQKHAQQVMSSLETQLESPQVATERSMQQQLVSHSDNQEPYNRIPETNSEQRRGSFFDDQSSRHSTEQKMAEEQNTTGPPMTRHSGEQSNRPQRYSGQQPAYNFNQGTGYPAASQGGHQSQQPMGAPDRYSGEQSNRYNDNRGSQTGPPMTHHSGEQSNRSPHYSGQHHGYNNTGFPPASQSIPNHFSTEQGDRYNEYSGSQSHGQMMPQTGNAPYSGTQSGNQFSLQSHQFNSHHSEVPYQSSSDQLFSGVSQIHPNSKRGAQQSNNYGSGPSGDASNLNDIKYPPDNFGSAGYSQYNSSSGQHPPVPFNQFNGQPHHNQYSANDPSPYPYQQQQQPVYQGHMQNPHQTSDHQQGNRNYATPQASRYGGGAGASGQQMLPRKPEINAPADPNATHSGGDIPHVKTLCKTPGCSFYAKADLEYYCDDCYEKSGLERYKKCPKCGKLVAGKVPQLCGTCASR